MLKIYGLLFLLALACLGSKAAAQMPGTDNLTDPYRFVKTIIKGDGDQARWDRFTMHNPQIRAFGDKYPNGIMTIPSAPGLGIGYDETIWKTAERIVYGD